jgi:putative DNA primase/helicase
MSGVVQPFDRELSLSVDKALLEEDARAEGAPTRREYHLTDVGNAERLIDAHGDDLLCVNGRGPWLAYDDTRWRWDDRGELVRRARATVKTLFQEAALLEGKERDALWTHARKSESDHALEAMISIARCDVPVQIDSLDRDPFLLNVRNGTIHLETGTLKPHRRQDLITKIAGTAYDPAATCPKWIAFLNRIIDNNAGLIGFLQRAVGYSLTGDTSEQVIFILYGTGANGKSTFLRLLADVLGDYARQAPARALLNNRNDEHPTAIAGLRGARLVSAVEVDEGRRLAEGLVKQLTGGDRVSARLMRQDYFEFTPTFKIILAVNHRPEIRGTDLAIWRRIRLVPFNVTIPAAEQDRHLVDTLRAELPGILSWAVQGCLAWQRDGLGAPAAVTTATETYRADMDLLAAFLETETVQGPDFSASKSDLYAAFNRWCETNGEQSITHKAFALRLSERGFKDWRGTGGRHFWRGIGLPAKAAGVTGDR